MAYKIVSSLLKRNTYKAKVLNLSIVLFKRMAYNIVSGLLKRKTYKAKVQFCQSLLKKKDKIVSSLLKKITRRK